MDISKLTIGQAREKLEEAEALARELGRPAPTGATEAATSHSIEVGQPYLIRTVTMAYTGRVVAVTDSDIVLEDAAWIADTGRYHEALTKGSLNEVEPYPDRVLVSRGGLIDMAPWSHNLPREAK